MNLWNTCLAELRRQLTESTFSTWLADSTANLHNDILTIYVTNSFAQDFLENRHKALIQRIATNIKGQPLTIRFAVRPNTNAEPLRSGDVLVTLFDPPNIPFLRIPFYSIWFWQPLLGHLAFATYQMLRTRDDCREIEWGQTNRINIETIALTLSTNRQAITGRRRRKANHSFWQPGTFDTLNQAQIANITPIGKGKNIVYDAMVLNTLPLLSPLQVTKLPPLLQGRHTNFMRRHNINTALWQQLELPNLIQQP